MPTSTVPDSTTAGNGQPPLPPDLAAACQPSPPALDIIGAADFAKLADEPTNYLIPGVVAAMEPHLISAAVKSLKTLLALDASISAAAAATFLGHDRFKVPSQTVTLFLSGESSAKVLSRKARLICEAKNQREKLPDGRPIALDNLQDYFWFSRRLPKIANARHLVEVGEAIERLKVRWLILDPAYLSFGSAGDKSDLGKQGELLDGMTRVCVERGCTPTVITHHKKTLDPEREQGDLYDVGGAGFAEWMRQWCYIRRRDRYVPGTGHHRLEMEIGGAEHSGRYDLTIEEGPPPGNRWQVTVVGATASAANDAAARTDAANSELAADSQGLLALLYADGPMSETQIARRLQIGRRSQRFDRLLSSRQ